MFRWLGLGLGVRDKAIRSNRVLLLCVLRINEVPKLLVAVAARRYGGRASDAPKLVGLIAPNMRLGINTQPTTVRQPGKLQLEMFFRAR